MAMKQTSNVNVDRRGDAPVMKEIRPDAPEARDANRDPISGAPGAHPVGVGIGAAATGAAGAAIGSVVPGVGTVIGGAIGAIIGAIGGGYAGKGIAEAIDPTTEDAYWRDELKNRPYYDERFNYESDYGPAFGYGYAMRSSNANRKFEEVEPELRDQWTTVRGESRLEWDDARDAVADAWTRSELIERERGNRPKA